MARKKQTPWTFDTSNGGDDAKGQQEARGSSSDAELEDSIRSAATAGTRYADQDSNARDGEWPHE